MTIVKTLIVAAVGAALLGGVAIWRGTSTDAAPSDRADRTVDRPADRAAPAPHAPAAPSLPATATTEHNPRDHATAKRSSFGVPTSYQLTVLAPTAVAVNLEGGPSPQVLFRDPPPPTFTRHVRGRVTDDAGHPIAGAVVVVAARLWSHWGSLLAEEGAATAADGTFDIAVHRDGSASAIALHPRGWSAPVAVPAGRDDAAIEIAVPAPGSLAIHVRQAGAPREAEIIVSAPGVDLGVDSDPHGDFALPLLAPGRYKVSAHAAQLFGGGTSPPVVKEVSVVAGATADVTIELPTGTLVIASVRHAGPLPTVEYFIAPGSEPAPALADLRARSREGKIHGYLLGGHDADQPAQLHDVAPGSYTLCVDATLSRDSHLPLVCRPLAVAADKPVLEVEIAIP